jgi:dTDP-4-dehydrorhamnose reductase
MLLVFELLQFFVILFLSKLSTPYESGRLFFKIMTPPKKILILGASSWIGHYLVEALSKTSTQEKVEILGTFFKNKPTLPCTWIPFDYQSSDSFFNVFSEFKPDVVVNLLGGTDEALFQFHKKLIETLHSTSTLYVFMSSSMAFDGEPSRPHIETDPVNGTSVYGKFKADCEKALRDVSKNYAIVRISAVHGFAPNKISRTERFLKRLSLGEKIEVDGGVFQNRLCIADMAEMLSTLILRSAVGIFHLGTIDQSEEIEFLGKLAKGFGYPETQLVLKPGPVKYLTVVPERIFGILGSGFRKTEEETIQKILDTPEFKEHKRT